MDQVGKDNLLNQAKDHLESTRTSIKQKLDQLEVSQKRGVQEFNRLSRADQFIQNFVLSHNEQRIEELKILHPSPYFVRCDIVYQNETQVRQLYFSKFSFHEKSIFSWAAPVSTIRFEDPGKFSYTKPNGQQQKGQLLKKDQFMIVDGKILFFTSESKDYPRELIYQEHFSIRKTGFVLPEIVAQMEKAQDKVIRAHHTGPFVISGPAGSGKTTLALHRVAYLVQSPETTKLYPHHTIAVFVQDLSTKKYFSQLLPQLGIRDIKITTFPEWTFKVLELDKFKYTPRFGATEDEQDLYEYLKLQALKGLNVPNISHNIYNLLSQIYQDYFNHKQQQLLQKQKQQKTLDKIDLSLLLKSYLKTHQQLLVKKAFYEELKNGRLVKKVKKVPLEYNLIIVDEFQNYLPDQLNIFKTCLNPKHNSIVYVGDMSQQTQAGTIQNWQQINENIQSSRHAILQKVYRNTKSILTYIQNLEYNVTIPDKIKQGVKVEEKIIYHKKEELEYLGRLTKKWPDHMIGIIAKEGSYLDEFKDKFKNNEHIYFFSMREAQGVEFDIVCLVGVNQDSFKLPNSSEAPQGLIQEKRRINKDLLYVALTRAMSQLHILGACKMQQSIKHLFITL